MVDSIRQIYEVEINELKKILQLFDSANSNESIAEILRLRKKIDELSANKVGRPARFDARIEVGHSSRPRARRRLPQPPNNPRT